jgi:hypothetical protein
MSGGFRDGAGIYLFVADGSFRGVWLSNMPLDANEGARGDTLLEVILDLPGKTFRKKFECIERGKPYKEFLVPALVLNRFSTIRIVPENEQDSIPG